MLLMIYAGIIRQVKEGANTQDRKNKGFHGLEFYSRYNVHELASAL